MNNNTMSREPGSAGKIWLAAFFFLVMALACRAMPVWAAGDAKIPEIESEEEDPSVEESEEENDGWVRQIIEGEIKWQYYADRVAAADTILEIEGSRYYFSGTYLYTGGMFYADGNTYYANPDGEDPSKDNLGVLACDTWVRSENTKGLWKYFDADGKLDETRLGMQKIGTAWYYLTEDGRINPGWHLEANGWYYLDPNGKAKTGWCKTGGKWYYLDTYTAVMKTGWYPDGDKWYYSDASGAMLSSGWKRLDGRWYYLKSSGEAVSGWLKLGNTWYYLNPENRAMCSGWYQVNGKWYYSEPSGAMVSSVWRKLGSKWYYFTGSGAAAVGWMKSGSAWYYLDPINCDMKTGWFKAKETWYYSSASGAMQTGWQQLGGKWYYFGGANDGAMRTGWSRVNGVRCYFGEADDGALRTGWFRIGETWYLAGPGGSVKTGWYKSGNIWYYFDPLGAMQIGWVKSGNSFYYMDWSGAMQTGWEEIDEKWYYFSASGAMQTGIQRIDGKTYMFDENGQMLENGEFVLNGITLSTDENGVVQGYSRQPYRISGFPVICQNPELPNGCEITALTMVLRYHGFSVSKMTMSETYLPKAEFITYQGSDGRTYGPDLDEYFVGDPAKRGTICGPAALVTAASRYLSDQNSFLTAKDITGCSFEELYMRVGLGQPVVIMSTEGMENRATPSGWYTESGKYVDWSTNDHSAVLIGWDENSVTVACPITGIQTYSRIQFEKVFASRGYRAMVLEP